MRESQSLRATLALLLFSPYSLAYFRIAVALHLRGLRSRAAEDSREASGHSGLQGARESRSDSADSAWHEGKEASGQTSLNAFTEFTRAVRPCQVLFCRMNAQVFEALSVGCVAARL